MKSQIMLAAIGSVGMLLFSGMAQCQCPVDTVVVKGRVENANSSNRVRVRLIYPKKRPGESGETTIENGSFQIPIEFVTMQSSIFKNLPKRCGRWPQTVVVTLLDDDQQSDEVMLDFAKEFRMVDASAYALRSALVLRTPR